MITHAELQRIEAIVAASRAETRAFQEEFKAWEERMRKLSQHKRQLKQELKCKASIP